MSYYADENGLYEHAVAGAVKISKDEYFEAFDHLCDGGVLKLAGGSLVLTFVPEKQNGFKDPVWQDGEWYFEPLPEQEETETEVPVQVTRAQGKTVLIQAGLWPSVLAFLDSIEDPTDKLLAEVALNDTTHWRRDSPFLNLAAAALNVTSEQMDTMFINANMIEL